MEQNLRLTNVFDLLVKTRGKKKEMISNHSESVAVRAKAIYAERLQSELESKYRDKYVAIEPSSGDHFIADSFGQAVAEARSAHPNQISFVIRIGHRAAIHMGAMSN